MHNIFDYSELSESMFYYEYAEQSLDEYDTDVLYNQLGTILYPILMKDNQSVGKYSIVQSIYKLMLNYAFFCRPYIFTKYFANKDLCDNIYHIIIDELHKYVDKLWSEMCWCNMSKVKLEMIHSADYVYNQYIVRPSSALLLNGYFNTDSCLLVLERVFSEPRLERYRNQWIDALAKDKSIDIALFNAICKSPLLCEHIKTVSIRINDQVKKMNTENRGL